MYRQQANLLVVDRRWLAAALVVPAAALAVPAAALAGALGNHYPVVPAAAPAGTYHAPLNSR